MLSRRSKAYNNHKATCTNSEITFGRPAVTRWGTRERAESVSQQDVAHSHYLTKLRLLGRRTCLVFNVGMFCDRAEHPCEATDSSLSISLSQECKCERRGHATASEWVDHLLCQRRFFRGSVRTAQPWCRQVSAHQNVSC